MAKYRIILPNGRLNTDIGTSRLRTGEGGPEFVLEWADKTAIGKDIVLASICQRDTDG